MCANEVNIIRIQKADHDKLTMNPDEYVLGVKYFHQRNRLDEVMNFLARYVRVVHADRYYRTLLRKQPGSSYLDIITASDVAYVLALLQNNVSVWLKKRTPEGNLSKPLFSAGEGKKRVYGITTWNKTGMAYYTCAKTEWQPAFTKNNPQYNILRQYWDKWIEDDGKKIMVGMGWAKKSAHFVLGSRCEAKAYDMEEDENGDNEVCEYESDPEDNTIDLGNWDSKREGRMSNNQDNINHSDDDGVNGGENDYWNVNRRGRFSDNRSDDSNDDDDVHEGGFGNWDGRRGGRRMTNSQDNNNDSDIKGVSNGGRYKYKGFDHCQQEESNDESDDDSNDRDNNGFEKEVAETLAKAGNKRKAERSHDRMTTRTRYQLGTK